MKVVYENIDWIETEELKKIGCYGFIVMKDGTKIIDHYVTVNCEVYSVLTRERSDKWPKLNFK